MLASLFIFWACCSALAVANDPEVRKDTSRVVHLANNADATRDYRLHQFDKCHLAFELNAVYGKLATPRRTLADVHVDDHASCLSLCQENPQCSLFVWHGNFPEIVGAAWARLCVQLTREEVQKLHVGPAESWRPQIGVISGQCRRNEVRKTVTVARGVNFNNSNPSMDRKGHQRSLAGQVQPSGDLSSNYRRVIQLPFSTRAISFAAAESRSCLMPELIIRSPQMTSETALLEVRRRLTLEVRPVENQSLAVNESLSLNGSVALDTGCVAALHAAVSVTVYGPDLYARSRNRHILTADRQGSNGSLRFTFMPTVPGTFTVVFLVGNQRYVWFQKIVPRNSLRSPTSSLGNFSIPSRPNTSMAHRPLLNGQMYEKILRRILDTQAPQKKCDLSSTSGRNRKFYFYALADVMNYGLGSHIEYMAAAFGRAMALNRTFVIPSKPGTKLVSAFGEQKMQYYWAERLCPGHQSWGCYFFMPSACTEGDLRMDDRHFRDLHPPSAPGPTEPDGAGSTGADSDVVATETAEEPKCRPTKANTAQTENLENLRIHPPQPDNLVQKEDCSESLFTANRDVDATINEDDYYIFDDGSPEFVEAEKSARVVVGDPCQQHVTKHAFEQLVKEFGLSESSRASDKVVAPGHDSRLEASVSKHIFQVYLPRWFGS
eukprot:INCI6486.1.p1 GENE.INCI6486.1~~INCI6486.1.p1  ORF type:complete len:662 (+),score=71.48 INCI6486.1:100-2085(+)